MSFWGLPLLPGGKVGTIGEEFTDVTVTRASISNAEAFKEGTRASLLCQDAGTGKWIVVCRFAIGREESVPLRLYVAAQDELKLKISGDVKIDLSGYQALPPFLDELNEDELDELDEENEMNMDSEDDDDQEGGDDEDEEEGDDDDDDDDDEEEESEEDDDEEEEEEEEAQVGQKRKAPTPAANTAAKATKVGGQTAAEAARDKGKQTPTAPPAAAKPGAEFIPSTKFQGSKPGYVFKKDKQGLGYYKDAKKAAPAAKKATAADAWAEKKLQAAQWRSGPGGLKIRDDKPGSGATPRKGATVTVHYTGKLKNGRQFDSSVGRKPLSFRYGAGQVIKGWDMGLEGMKIGGKRSLEIPAALGYGKRGAPPDIPPNATLMFEVQLLKC